METREEYLTRMAGEIITRILEPVGYDTNDETKGPLSDGIRVSVGWPSARALNKYGRTLGQTFNPLLSKDGTTEIFITPFLDEPHEIAGVLTHELVHAAIGVKHNHNAFFEQACHKVGLDGPATSTIVPPGSPLAAEIDAIVKDLGAFPHAALDIALVSKKKAITRLLKCTCTNADCPTQATGGFVVRITQKWAGQYREGAQKPVNEKPWPKNTGYAYITLKCPTCMECMACELPLSQQSGGPGGSGETPPPSQDMPDSIKNGKSEGSGDAPEPDPDEGDVTAPPPPDDDSDDESDDSDGEGEGSGESDEGDEEEPDASDIEDEDDDEGDPDGPNGEDEDGGGEGPGSDDDDGNEEDTATQTDEFKYEKPEFQGAQHGGSGEAPKGKGKAVQQAPGEGSGANMDGEIKGEAKEKPGKAHAIDPACKRGRGGKPCQNCHDGLVAAGLI